MKKKILTISAVLLFVISSVAIGGDRDYDVFIHKGHERSGIASALDRWTEQLKERRQKEGMQAIAKMLQHDDISMAELFRPVRVELSRQLKIKFFFLEPFVVFFISF